MTCSISKSSYWGNPPFNSLKSTMVQWWPDIQKNWPNGSVVISHISNDISCNENSFPLDCTLIGFGSIKENWQIVVHFQQQWHQHLQNIWNGHNLYLSSSYTRIHCYYFFILIEGRLLFNMYNIGTTNFVGSKQTQ